MCSAAARPARSSPICWWPCRACRAARGEGGDASLLRALAQRSGLGLRSARRDAGDPWPGRGRPCSRLATGRGARAGDTVERLELLARRWSPARGRPAPGWARTRAVLDAVERRAAPGGRRLRRGSELRGLLAGLDGRRVAPGPSGAPTRGRPEVLPTGRNFYSVDCRAVPTPAAWQLGWRSADAGRRAATCSATATGRAGWRCRPGAPPTCAPAATTSPRRWRCSAAARSGTTTAGASPASRSCRSPCWAGRGST